MIGISQSGETRDTIHAMRLAREKGARTLAITNMMGTQITREVDTVLYTRAGLEMSVAASKTFTAQVALLYLVALKLAQVRRRCLPEEIASLLDEVTRCRRGSPRFSTATIRSRRSRSALREAVLPLPRSPHRPAGLPRGRAEAEGDLLHPDRGVLGRRDEARPDRAARRGDAGRLRGDRLARLRQGRLEHPGGAGARAQVIAIATDGNEDIQHHADDVIYVPRTHPFLQAALAVIPLQLLAYRIARLRGLNVDQPRNLAKTVTVE